MRADAVVIHQSAERDRIPLDRPAGMNLAISLFQFREIERFEPDSVPRRIVAAEIIVTWRIGVRRCRRTAALAPEAN